MCASGATRGRLSMNLTFKGFLKQYCQELAGEETTSLKRLAERAASDVPRVAEPLLLFAAKQDKIDYLKRLSAGTWLEVEFDSASAEIPKDGGSLEDALERGDLPPRYEQVWHAYIARRHAVDADRRVIGLMREIINDAMARSGATCYRVSKELGLNQGNVYAYLHGGDNSKVSRATARRIYRHVVEGEAA